MYVNKKVDAFVSIHHNANTGTWNNATGVEIFTDKNPTAKDTELAKAIYKNLPSYTGLRGRGIKEADFTVINQDSIPAVLCEGGFMDSTIDHKVITSKEGQKAYAKAVAEGLIAFLNLQKKPVEVKELYRVGTSWSNGKCVGQVGAYSNKDNAINKAKENNAYKVFDSKGTIVYQYVKPATTTTTTTTNKIDTVKEVQSWANTNYKAGLTVDGAYGANTKKALVKILQTELNQTYGSKLTVDGIWGSKTKSACPTLKNGSKNDVVGVLQALLICNGHTSAYLDKDYGSATVSAVKAYQKKKGLDADGIAGKNTFEALCK